MKYSDVKVGQRVLVGYRRTNHPEFEKNADLGTVLEVGVPHRYWVTTGGWEERRESRETDQGIRVKVDRYDEPQVTIAAKLRLVDAEEAERIEEAERAEQQAQAERAEKKERLALLQAEIGKRAGEGSIRIYMDHWLLLDEEAATRILDALKDTNL